MVKAGASQNNEIGESGIFPFNGQFLSKRILGAQHLLCPFMNTFLHEFRGKALNIFFNVNLQLLKTLKL